MQNILRKEPKTHYTNYKKCRNQQTHVKNKAKRNYFENLFREAKHTSNTWKHI